jgi:hypothetical protein
MKELPLFLKYYNIFLSCILLIFLLDSGNFKESILKIKNNLILKNEKELKNHLFYLKI